MKRREFVLSSASTAALAPLLGLAGCNGGNASPFTAPAPAGPSKAGPLLAKRLNTIANFPDSALFNLLQQTAAAKPSPQQVEVALQLLGAYSGTQPQYVPGPIPPAKALSFPADHAEHDDTQIEWRYITLSLPLSNGGLVSVIANFFRKEIVFAKDSPGSAPLDRQLYSTSIAVTIEMPGQTGVHYALPTISLAAADGTVSVGNNPFHLSIGANSLTSSDNNVFPLHVHIEDAGDASVGRPAIVIDVDCQNTNPLFLQGANGFVGVAKNAPSTVGWYYYSWPQQKTSGTVKIGGASYGVSNGLAWMDHQWGGAPVATSGPISDWSGWCWFEFQFDGNRSLTLAAPHGPISGGVLPPNMFAFGTYVESGTSQIVYGTLNVGSYVASPSTTAKYASSWSIAMTSLDQHTLVLAVTPTTTVEPQAMWMGQLTEYAEANCTVTATGTLSGGAPFQMNGVGYCEGVGFEDPTLMQARQKAFLQSKL